MAKNDHHDDDTDRGLTFDLQRLAQQQRNRREILRWLGGASLLGLGTRVLAACTDGASSGPDASSSGGSDGSGGGADSCSTIPEETEGPYPGDGSNGKNALNQTGIVRSDIRSSFGSASGVAAGVPLTVTLKLVNTNASCAPLAGYAIYIWHCDAEGRYSMYSAGATDENYLRGVQVTDDSGEVTFTTIFPGCYAGRWPHIHFEIYPAVPTSYSSKVKTSQLAFPESDCDAVYATDGYPSSSSNLASLSLDSDGIFRDGYAKQIPTMGGNVGDGYTATLNVGINA